jgi:sec-independent protein translocase protein TatB
MFDIGFLEIGIIAAISLIVLGPERLPTVARTIGKTIGMVRRHVGNFQRQIEQDIRLEELNQKIMEDTKGQQFPNNDELDPGIAEPQAPTEPDTTPEVVNQGTPEDTAEADTSAQPSPKPSHNGSEESRS